MSRISIATLIVSSIVLLSLTSIIYVHHSRITEKSPGNTLRSATTNILVPTASIQSFSNSRSSLSHSTSSAAPQVASTETRKAEISSISTAQSPAPAVSTPTSNHIRPTLHTVTYASHSGRDDRFCRAVESAVRHEYKLVILGWKLPWKGLSQKLEAAHAYAASLPPDDLLLFTDAFDVLFTAKPEHIVEQFLRSNASILFSAECGCWPHIMENKGKACFDAYPPAPQGSPYRYLNSGTWIGRAHMAKLMLEEVIREAGLDFANANDQKLVADMFISGRFCISLDYYNSIFQSMHLTLDPPLPRCNPMEDLVLQPDGAGWVNKRTHGTPALIHFNGGGKRHHLNMEGKMWYKNGAFNSLLERTTLANYELIVPTMPEAKLAFKELCRDYFVRG